MGKPFQITDTTFLEKALNAASLRQQVISNNIANVNNPNYQGQTVVFEGHLREAMETDKAEGKEDSVVPTNVVDQEFSIEDAGGWNKASLAPTVESQSGKLSVNNEMASLAKNQIMYNALASKISGVYGTLKWVVENTGR